MVVEILEEKLDREYCDNAAKLMMQAVGNPLCAMSDDEMEDLRGGGGGMGERKTNKNNNDSMFDLPKDWEPMNNDEVIYICVLSV